MITNLNDFKNFKINEAFHGSPDRAEIIQDGDRVIANYTGSKLVKHPERGWLIIPKVGDVVYATISDEAGFSTGNLNRMEIVEVIPAHKLIIAEYDGFEKTLHFHLAEAGTSTNDLIAYYRADT